MVGMGFLSEVLVSVYLKKYLPIHYWFQRDLIFLKFVDQSERVEREPSRFSQEIKKILNYVTLKNTVKSIFQLPWYLLSRARLKIHYKIIFY